MFGPYIFTIIIVVRSEYDPLIQTVEKIAEKPGRYLPMSRNVFVLNYINGEIGKGYEVAQKLKEANIPFETSIAM